MTALNILHLSSVLLFSNPRSMLHVERWVLNVEVLRRHEKRWTNVFVLVQVGFRPGFRLKDGHIVAKYARDLTAL